jgi:pyridoxal biosynthesis lyase PdxS
MIRTKGEAGTGNVVEAVRHMRTMMSEIRTLSHLPAEERMNFAKEIGAPLIWSSGQPKTAACRSSILPPAA